MAYRDRRDVAHEHVEQDDKQQTKSCTFASSRLPVHFGEWEGPTAVDDGVKVRDAVQDGNDIAQGCEEAQCDLGEDSLGKIDFRVGKL
jgi:hypothetical protein